MKHDDYFQFPLCALAYEGDIRTRLNAIIDYALIEAGAKLFQKLTVGQRQEFINTQRREGKLPHNFDASNWDYNAVLYGASILRVNYHGNYDSALRWHKSLSKFIRSFEGEHGRDALVRIKQAWLFKTRDGKGITYREFSVLCAIFSALGDKKMVIVTRHRVVRCALGYRKRLILDSELSRRKDKASPLTERQVRDTIDRLHRNKFFARATVSRRFTYYSNRLDNETLRKEIIKRRTYPAFFNATRSAQDQALTAAINQQKRKAAAMITPPPLGGP